MDMYNQTFNSSKSSHLNSRYSESKEIIKSTSITTNNNTINNSILSNHNEIKSLITDLKVKTAEYCTSLDFRKNIPVYEYMINSQPILWDQDRTIDYVYWTGIWKALGRDKSEISKLVDADPSLHGKIKKIRGGFLKIQGTWIPRYKARELALLTCWPIRHELVPIFGDSFPDEAIPPTDPRFIHPPVKSINHKLRNETRKYNKSNSTKKNNKKSNQTTVRNFRNLLPPWQEPIKKEPLPMPKPYARTTPKDTSYYDYENYKLPPLNPNFQRTNPNLPHHHYPIASSPSRTTPTSNDLLSNPYESCAQEFCEDPQYLNDAINASLLLQKLSQDDGSIQSKNKVFYPPTTFSIGGKVFRLVESDHYKPL